MKKVASILSKRFGALSKPKMKELAEKTTEGEFSSFSAIFGVAQLDPEHVEQIRNLLVKYAPSDTDYDFSTDLNALLSITREVKAITNQAAILHGQRIKSAQLILKKYRDGAFSSWLLTTYGNRQTPYNFLQYYEFYKSLPKELHPQIEAMPRQAIYTLASRKGPLEKKEEIVKNYHGETKQQLISLIRNIFPLDAQDKRQEKLAENILSSLKRVLENLQNHEVIFTHEQKRDLLEMMEKLHSFTKE